MSDLGVGKECCGGGGGGGWGVVSGSGKGVINLIGLSHLLKQV